MANPLPPYENRKNSKMIKITFYHHKLPLDHLEYVLESTKWKIEILGAIGVKSGLKAKRNQKIEAEYPSYGNVHFFIMFSVSGAL